MRSEFNPSNLTVTTAERTDGLPSLKSVGEFVHWNINYYSGGGKDLPAHRIPRGFMLRQVRHADPNTGMPGKREFSQDVEREASVYLRANVGKSRPEPGFTLLIADVNDLTGINIAGGYAAGDRVITGVGAIARRLAGRVEHASAYRFGDEFAFLFRNETNDPKQFAENFGREVSRETIAGHAVTVAAGIALMPEIATARALLSDFKVKVDQRRLANVVHPPAYLLRKGPAEMTMPEIIAAGKRAMKTGDAEGLAYLLDKSAHVDLYINKYFATAKA